MADITKSQYFFYGAAEGVQYALYEPVSDRFVLVSKFAESLKSVALLFSGKLSLRLCKVHSATNFNENLLDNTCCSNWTINDVSEMAMFRGHGDYLNMDVFPVTTIVPAAPLDGPELIVDNQEFLMATYIWVTSDERDDFSKMHEADPFAYTELSLASHIVFPMESSPATIDIKKIHNIIFTETDFDVARTKVEAILETHTT